MEFLLRTVMQVLGSRYLQLNIDSEEQWRPDGQNIARTNFDFQKGEE
jgi:hypothetical protein